MKDGFMFPDLAPLAIKLCRVLKMTNTTAAGVTSDGCRHDPTDWKRVFDQSSRCSSAAQRALQQPEERTSLTSHATCGRGLTTQLLRRRLQSFVSVISPPTRKAERHGILSGAFGNVRRVSTGSEGCLFCGATESSPPSPAPPWTQPHLPTTLNNISCSSGSFLLLRPVCAQTPDETSQRGDG